MRICVMCVCMRASTHMRMHVCSGRGQPNAPCDRRFVCIYTGGLYISVYLYLDIVFIFVRV